MKRLLAGAALLTFLAAPAVAQNIVGSSHDMSTYFGTSSTDQVCIYCHAPHTPNPGGAPLWNHTLASGPFSMYPDANLAGTVAATPNGRSLQCLGCHDGVTNVDAYGGGAGTVTIGAAPVSGAASSVVGVDLKDDHPVSVTINTTSSDFNTPVDTKIYTDGTDWYVECSSCHNPHDETTFVKFLRETPAASAICLDCHNK
jgi:predicted CXXCH cytochrome family protein